VTVDWHSVPAWVDDVYQSDEHLWRDIRTFNQP
jgi:hypothetical protein